MQHADLADATAITDADVIKLCRACVLAGRVGRHGLQARLSAHEIDLIGSLQERYLLMQREASLTALERQALDECLTLLSEPVVKAVA